MIGGLNGWCQSAGAPGGVVAMTAWFSNRERGRIYGIWSTAHPIGEGLTFLVVGTLAALLGWRFGFWVPDVIGVVTPAGCWLLMRNRSDYTGMPNVADCTPVQYGTSGVTQPGPRRSTEK